MTIQKKVQMATLMAITLTAFVLPASAITVGLPTGGTVVPLLDNTIPFGALLGSTTVNLAPLSQTFSGTYHEEAYSWSGGVVLAYQLNVGPGANISDPVIRATMNPFLGYTTAVAFRTTAFGGFSASTIAPGSADRNASGDTVGFSSFGPSGTGIPSGSSSAVLLVFTNATSVTRNAFMSAIDGGTSTSLAIGPSGGTETPEPTTFGAVGLALVALGLIRRKI